mgnify:CR=1 FL=1
MSESRHLDPEPDLLLVVLQRVRLLAPGLTDAQAAMVESEVRAELGGLRVRIPKRRKHLSEEQRQAIAREALAATDTDAQITERHRIGRASLYRYLKRGTGP